MMFFELLALALTVRCMFIMCPLRARFFHDQAWLAWMTFLVMLFGLHVAELLGVVVMVGPNGDLGVAGNVIEVAAIVTFWIALELSGDTFARRWLETHSDVRDLVLERDRQSREPLSKTAQSVQPSGSESHSQGAVSLTPVMSSRRSRV